MPKLVANGIDFHYQQAGAGPDVVLIHGVTGDLSIWFLCEAMGILGRSFRVTAFDLRGHGYSGISPDGYTSADQAADALAIMDALEIDHAALVGHSQRRHRHARRGALPRSRRCPRALRPLLSRPAASRRRQPMGPLAELSPGSRRRGSHSLG